MSALVGQPLVLLEGEQSVEAVIPESRPERVHLRVRNTPDHGATVVTFLGSRAEVRALVEAMVEALDLVERVPEGEPVVTRRVPVDAEGPPTDL